MPEEPLPNRQSIRCKGWDYTAPGWYFLTFNTKARRPVFGTIVNGRMALNAAGRIAEEEWHRSAEIRQNLALDAFVVMPDHVHGIVRIVAREGDLPPSPRPRFGQPIAGSVGTFIAAYKAAMIWVKPFGLAQGGDSAAIQTAIAEERLLILSPFDDAIEAPSARRAVWCNHYVIANSTRLVVGHLNPDGMLACLLCETPPDLKIQYL